MFKGADGKVDIQAGKERLAEFRASQRAGQAAPSVGAPRNPATVRAAVQRDRATLTPAAGTALGKTKLGA